MADGDSIVARVFRHAGHAGAREALVCGATRITYAELAERVLSVARCWREEGVQRGDRILLAATTSPGYVFGYFAAHVLGAIAIPVDPAAATARIARIAGQVQPARVYLPSAVERDGLSARAMADVDRMSLERREGTPFDWRAPGANDIADLIFTTGTTGAPKGVVLSHGNIRAAADSINAFVGNSASDREVIPLPLSLSFGLGRLRCVLSAGGCLVLVDGMMFAEPVLEALTTERATGFCFVPSGLALLLRLTGDKLGEFADRLSYIEIGSAPMPREHKTRLMALLPKTRICMHYGLTEGSRSAFIEFHADQDHLDSVGRASPGVEIRIWDPAGRPVPDGDTGEICVRGGHVMQGYWHNEQETAIALRDGWLHTGDIGRKDAGGYVYLVGREKELINVGGRKVIPAEVESVLCEHPAVSECACVAVPDPGGLSEEAVKACLVPSGGERPSPRDFARFLRGRLEPYKFPSVYEWVAEIPKTASGKIQRQLLARGAAG